MSRAAANQERGTKNQELPKTPALNTAGFFIIHLILSVQPRTKSSRAAATYFNLNCRTAATFTIHYSKFTIPTEASSVGQLYPKK